MTNILRRSRLRMVGWLCALVILAGCSSTPKVDIPVVTSLPPTGRLILTVDEYNQRQAALQGTNFYLVDADSGAIALWQLQGGRGITENGGSCQRLGGWGWSAARQQLFWGDLLGCQLGPYLIGVDGAVQVVPNFPNGTADDLAEEHSLSHDGRTVAYGAGHRDPAGTDLPSVYLFDLASGEDRRLTPPLGTIYSLAWKPDDSVLAFNSVGSVYMVKRDGSGLRMLIDSTRLGPQAGIGKVAWSPDGRTLAFMGTASDQTQAGKEISEELSNVWLLDTQTDTLREIQPRLSHQPTTGLRNFAWSPDGKELALIAGYDGVCRANNAGGVKRCTSFVYRIQADGSNLIKVTNIEQSGATGIMWLR